jgi:hypothetical protein
MADPQMALTAWLVRARITDDPEGDLIDDMRSELRRHILPGSFSTENDLRGYLAGRGACREALAAVPGVGRRYCRYRWRRRYA